MTAAAADGGGATAALRKALGALYRELRVEAKGGTVPESVFRAKSAALGLGKDGQARLRAELRRMGLRIGDFTDHAPEDTLPSQKVAQGRGATSERVEAARALLNRCVGSAGQVTEQALRGVARLAGLDAREVAALRETVVAQEPAPVRTRPAAAPKRPEPPTPPAEERSAPARSVRTERAGDGISRAVAAAKALIAGDRFERRLGRRLLTAEEEVGLAILIRGGVKRMAQEPEAGELVSLAADDVRRVARDCLVLHNQRLVHKIAQRYQDQGLEYDDLVQHGMLGVIRAARKFDPTHGNKFSTYATWWIRQAITRAIADEGALIRIPVHMHEVMRKVANAERRLQSEGRPQSAADVAVACDVKVETVEQVRRISRRTDSLDRVIGDGVHLGDLLAEANPLPSAEYQAMANHHLKYLLSFFDLLDQRSRRIMLARIGLDGDEPLTLEELGKEFGVTRERIRQLETKASAILYGQLRAVGIGRAPIPDSRKSTNQSGKRQRESRKPNANRKAAQNGNAGHKVADAVPNERRESLTEQSTAQPRSYAGVGVIVYPGVGAVPETLA